MCKRFVWRFYLGSYGQSGIQAFRELTHNLNICIARDESIPTLAPDEAYDYVIGQLLQDKNANVVVCFCEGKTVNGLLAATKRMNVTRKFLIIGR